MPKSAKKEKRQKNRTVGKIFLVVAIVIIMRGVYMGNSNVKVMNSCVNAVLNELQDNFKVTKLDTGEYGKMKLFGLVKFHVEQYQIEELGNLSIMRVNMGLMQMATVVITPSDKNLPLLSADYMYIMSNRKCYLEFYDVVKEKDEPYVQLLNELSKIKNKYEHLENIETTPAWYQHLLTVTTYKTGKNNADADLEKMLMDNLHVYIEHSKKLPVLSREQKKEKQDITLEYTDGLIEKGGISTDVFKKALGEEKTKKFFDKVFFGTVKE